MGANIFTNINNKIDAKTAKLLQNEIMQKILNKYPTITLIPVGSVGKKDYNNDIDIAVLSKDIQQLEKIIKVVFADIDIITIESLYVISIKYPYIYNNETKYVQCDFINVWDIEYTKFRYYCPDYTKNESKYKVGQKIMFANMIINHCIDLRKKDLLDNQISKYLFEPTALFRMIIDKNLMQYKKKIVTLDPNTVAGMCFYDSNINHFNSIETLWDAIHTDNYKYPEEVSKIERNFFINCWRKGWDNIVPEDFKLQYWTNEEIWNFINEQKNINKINNIFSVIANMKNK